ncbi:unnamed protein product [Calicophoron daubneyi]|uniref:Tetraspanin n=1 Tax=Calicophoron daubneyi TaxID=300641 RepID=A0AAV2TNE5_CALDB
MVSLSCGYKCLQCILIVFNILVIISGIGLIIIGSLAEVQLKSFTENTDRTLQGLVIFIITLGSAILLVGFFGFCGACMKNVCMLTTYSILLAVAAIVLVVVGVIGLIMREEVHSVIAENLNAVYKEYYKSTQIKSAIDLIQRELKCCGPNGTWISGSIPDSCKSSSGIYTDGCITNFNRFLKKNLAVVAACVFAFALLLIICMVFAVCVIQAIQRGEAEMV